MTGPLTGKVFEAEIRRSLKAFEETHDNFWWMRLSDYRTWIAANPKLINARQPADFVAIFRGIAHFFECKSTQMARGWNCTYLRPHQHESLNAIHAAGGRAWILIRNHSVKYHNSAWALSIYEYDWLRDHLPPTRASFSWEAIDERGLRLPLCKGKIWDLSPVLEVR